MIRHRPADDPQAPGEVEILANLSMSLDRLAMVFLVLSAVTLLVALWPTVLGYWPIMLIAAVHLLIVGWCFRIAWRGNWARQRVLIGPEHTRVEHFALRARQTSEWSTPWVRVELDRSGAEPRLFLGSHGKRVELGRFVNAGEREQAAEILERELKAHAAPANTTKQK